ncbi:MAG: hypothetical protein ACPG5B_03530 [Chitinophagales bacterium]
MLNSEVIFFAQLMSSLFFAILFLQSALDKIVDWSGNLSWLEGHFAKSPLAGFVPFMLLGLTIVELAAGATSALGVFSLWFFSSSKLALIGVELSALSLVMLFFGQRLAKDYAGAATIASYFAVALLSLLLFS